MTPKEILTQARALITDPEHWTKGKAARNAQGRSVNSDSPKATCFCSIGAVHRAAYGEGLPVLLETFAVLKDALPGGESPNQVASFNDWAKHSEVLELFDRAIASCP